MSKRIRIQESLGTVELLQQVDESTKSSSTQLEEGKKYTLKPTIEAIHAGLTKNKTFYPQDKLQGDAALDSGIYSWTRPYDKPIIKNHDTDSEPLGRVTEAYFVKNSSNGEAAVVVQPTITDQEAIEKILDGRYATVSIGAETDEVRCSICGANLLEEEWGAWGHEHKRGEKYDGQEAYWIIGNLWFHELSFVNVPADKHARVIDRGTPVEVKESDQDDDFSEMILDLDLGKFVKVGESADAHTDGSTEPKSGEEDNPVAKEKEKETPVTEGQDNPNTPEVDPKDKDKTPAEGSTTEKNDEELNLEEAQTKLKKYSKTIVGLTAERDELKDRVAELTQEIETLKEQHGNVEDLQEQLTTAESKVQTLESENETLTDRVAELEAEIHQSVAERVVDLKIALHKVKEEDREDQIQEHLERSAESLRDTLKDLQTESAKGIALLADFVEKVKNPGYVLDGDTDGDAEESAMTNEDVLRALLTKKRR